MKTLFITSLGLPIPFFAQKPIQKIDSSFGVTISKSLNFNKFVAMAGKSILQYFLVLTIALTATASRGQKIFSIQTDQRVEALSIFFTLATADTLDTKPACSTYYRDVLANFKPYCGHSSLNW